MAVTTNASNMMSIASAIAMPGLSQPDICSCFFASKKSVDATSSYCATKLLRKRSSNSKHCNNLNLSSCCCATDRNSSSDWDWSRWSRHFSEIEQAESLVSVLKIQLDDAIRKEKFEDAAKLKMSMEEAASNDSISEIMSLLKNAIEEERYHDASRLSKKAGSGLVGWWVGCSNSSHDPFGRLVHITPSVGRFIGWSYTPRQLVMATPGTPIFEIYVIKDADGTYNLQAVYLQRAKTKLSEKSEVLVSNITEPLSTSQTENMSPDIEVEKDKKDKNEEKDLPIEGATEEGIKSVIKFLKDRIPGLKIKVMDVGVSKGDDSVSKLIQQDEKDGSGEISDNESNNLDELDREATDILNNEKNKDMKVFVGDVLHNEETPKNDFVRLPAEVKDMEKDYFVLHIPGRKHDSVIDERKMPKFMVAALAAQGVSGVMPPELAKAFLNVDQIPSAIRKDIRELVKVAVSQVHKRNELSDYTNFSRVLTSGGDIHPFEGLFVGAFGPYGTEVVQLRRKFGFWNDSEEATDVGFFEYVEAVKITGDINVPAGQVTFRAKIGKGNRTSNRGLYPDELGVVSSYRGQGRIAESGFQNPRWVDGEFLQLSGRSFGPYVRGADLGFLYVVPEQSFMVLFNRLKLPD